jgi:hypothetical protein
MSGAKFLFRVTLRRLDLVSEVHMKEPSRVPLILSQEETKRPSVCWRWRAVYGTGFCSVWAMDSSKQKSTTAYKPNPQARRKRRLSH